MKQYKKHIDDLYKEKLGSYRETPPADAWEELESRLDTLKPGAPTPPYRWLLHVAIVSLLLVSSVSIMTKFFNRNSEDSKTLAQNAQDNRNNQQPAPAPVPASTQPNPGQQPVNPAATATPQKGTEPGLVNSAPVNTQTNYTPSASNTQNSLSNRSGKQHSSAAKQTTHNTGKTIPTYSPNAYNSNTGTLATNRSKLSNPAPEEESDNANNQQATSPNTTLSVVKTPDAQATSNKKPATKPQTSTASTSRTRTSADFARIEAGVKIGYESGFSNNTDNKVVISPYIQYNISSKLAILTQPGIKYAATPDHNLGSPATYYNESNETSTTKVTQSQVLLGTNEYNVNYYKYTQSYDSIIKSNKIGGASMQYELPILLKYNLSNKLSVYGGVNFVFNKLTSIIENTYTSHITRSIYDTTYTPVGQVIQQPNLGFTYTGKPIQEYMPLTADKTGYQFSTGFMVGFSYAYSKKWLVDALMEQNPSTPDVKAGYNINAPLSATYFRLSIGYKLAK